jgi:hypothetical protein
LAMIAFDRSALSKAQRMCPEPNQMCPEPVEGLP